ncbi:MAG: hypothetical protein QOC87_238 [Actinomycetota bacterium]|nr:hypothetical protein [Actinomycetota bacterium]
MRRKLIRFVSLLLAGALLMAVGGIATATLAGAGAKAPRAVHPRPAPKYDPARFSARISNAWYPLKPGVVYVYKGRDGNKRSRDVLKPTDRVAKIDGVPCRVVNDKVYLNGVLHERTLDYYTQDAEGNVWYFAEDTAELDKNGNVTSTAGTWRTGRNGAEAGIFMQANPQVGDTFQQEFYRGHAEDHYQVLSLKAEVTVPYGHFGQNALRRNVELTKEWSPLEPNVRDHKVYVRGIGTVKEKTVRGGRELLKLVKIKKR